MDARRHGVLYSHRSEAPEICARKTRKRIRRAGMTLNRKKTRVRTNAQRRRVTGLVVNERVRTDRDYRRALRQELYYCQKYGIEAHVTRKNITGGAENYARSLLGRVTRALSFEAGDASLARGRVFLINYLTSENLTSENAEE